MTDEPQQQDTQRPGSLVEYALTEFFEAREALLAAQRDYDELLESAAKEKVAPYVDPADDRSRDVVAAAQRLDDGITAFAAIRREFELRAPWAWLSAKAYYAGLALDTARTAVDLGGLLAAADPVKPGDLRGARDVAHTYLGLLDDAMKEALAAEARAARPILQIAELTSGAALQLRAVQAELTKFVHGAERASGAFGALSELVAKASAKEAMFAVIEELANHGVEVAGIAGGLAVALGSVAFPAVPLGLILVGVIRIATEVVGHKRRRAGPESQRTETDDVLDLSHEVARINEAAAGTAEGLRGFANN